MEEDYSKREIDEFMKDIRETLAEILAQTKKTNGRVSSLEVWRGFMTGGLAIITIVILPVIFILIK